MDSDTRILILKRRAYVEFKIEKKELFSEPVCWQILLLNFIWRGICNHKVLVIAAFVYNLPYLFCEWKHLKQHGKCFQSYHMLYPRGCSSLVWFSGTSKPYKEHHGSICWMTKTFTMYAVSLFAFLVLSRHHQQHLDFFYQTRRICSRVPW